MKDTGPIAIRSKDPLAEQTTTLDALRTSVRRLRGIVGAPDADAIAS
jgi:hypothetical protein